MLKFPRFTNRYIRCTVLYGEYIDNRYRHTNDVCPFIACCVIYFEIVFRSLIFGIFFCFYRQFHRNKIPAKYKCSSVFKYLNILQPRHEISNNVVCATSEASDQPAHTHSLIRAFCKSLEYSVSVKLLTEHHFEVLSLKRGCTGSSESTLVKMSHCCKSHVVHECWWRESWWVFFDCLLYVLWLLVFCGSSSWFRGLVSCVWLWYFLVILSYFLYRFCNKWKTFSWVWLLYITRRTFYFYTDQLKSMNISTI